ncbi:peptide-methionine (S)-S-oxide reductase MsrA [Flavobacterium urocaniciphilum]|uniref:Peptide methionine sulfoxide reductase MsrA n=1 Tax=Flavobacterium urocaniciphilum TaxID=1299341 RepID=A0A1H8ZHI7_9FLAO|nr:peptide-methionine (S)-S-oxide reductase MsrA [Flavobacterium urocaniciphilum]SEP63821.1 peptide-methionine (S)-S-oxide reductase [Flavobacterium urocaniciphilum]
MKNLGILISFLSLISCGNKTQVVESKNENKDLNKKVVMNDSVQIATFAGGCFWCTEAVFLEVKGVEKVVSGYTGGFIKNPAYREVCNGTTGHAEGIQITFNPKEVAYEDLLEIFFATHDPTTLNKQGNDIGTQYRSAIFYHSPEQKEKAEKYIKLIEQEKLYSSPIVTQVEEAGVFYSAEDYHQNYYNQNKEQGYCQYIIAPKLDKLRKYYKSMLK